MSQKQNKFIVGYGVVTAVGAAVLGYLCYSASTENEEAVTNLKNKESQVAQLQKAPLYPNPENVKKKAEQVDAYSVELDKLQNALITFQRPLDNEIKGDAVNIKLGKYKAALEAIATGRGITLPQSFDVGLGRYLTGSPELAAAPKVDYLVDSVNALLTRLFQNGISKLDLIECPKQAYEEDKTGVVVPEKKVGKAAPKKAVADKNKKAEAKEVPPALPEDSVFTRYKIRLQFTSSEKAAQDFLNEIATLPKDGPFYIVNLLRVENEKKVGPSKGATFTPAAVPGIPGGLTGTTAMIDSHYILGNEKIMVYLDMDLVRFLDPSVAKEDDGAPAK